MTDKGFRPLAGIMVLILVCSFIRVLCRSFRPLAGIMVLIQEVLGDDDELD